LHRRAVCGAGRGDGGGAARRRRAAGAAGRAGRGPRVGRAGGGRLRRARGDHIGLRDAGGGPMTVPDFTRVPLFDGPVGGGPVGGGPVGGGPVGGGAGPVEWSGGVPVWESPEGIAVKPLY